MSKERKLQLSRKEWIVYSILLFVAFVGLVFVVIGIIGDYLPVVASKNWVRISEAAWLTNWSPLGYRYWGIVLLCGGLILFSLALVLFSRESDRDSERAQRRAKRLAAMNQIETEETKAE